MSKFILTASVTPFSQSVDKNCHQTSRALLVDTRIQALFRDDYYHVDADVVLLSREPHLLGRKVASKLLVYFSLSIGMCLRCTIRVYLPVSGI